MFYENNFTYLDETEDYDNYFCYYFIIGKTDEGRYICAEMKGWVNDKESDNFAINICNADTNNDRSIIGYWLDDERISHNVEVPDNVAKQIFAKTKELVIKSEIQKVKDCAEFYADGAVSITEDADGLLCFEAIGEFNGNPIYADFHAKVIDTIMSKHDKDIYHLSPVYNMDEDKAYIIVPNEEFTDRKIAFDMPHDILEKCEKQAAEMAYRIKCDELHKRLYNEYVQNCKDGFEVEDEDELVEFDEWLSRLYPDEGYFAYHVTPEDAKFLCEHDELIDLSYYELYEESIKSCFSLTSECFENRLNDSPDSRIQHFDINDAGLFHEDIDRLILRSEKPDLLKEMCEEYEVSADNFPALFDQAEDMSNYIGFEIDLTGKTPEVTAYLDIDTAKSRYSLGQIPLSAKEYAFVLKACDKKFKEITGKSLLDVSKEDKTIER